MKTLSFTSLKSQFLIAMPKMVDSSFASTLTVICEHNPQGALGIIVNRPTNLKVEEIFHRVGIEQVSGGTKVNNTVYSGGPVAVDRGFVLNSSEHQWESCLRINDDVQLTTSRDILLALAAQEGPADFLLALGYAGWGAGQLEQELADNAWLNCEFDPTIIFNTPAHLRLNKAASSLGVDLSLISGQVGHA